MGAKTWMAVFAEGDARHILASKPSLNREETQRTASALFPKERLVPLADTCLTWTSPPDDEIHIACFPGLTIVAAKEFAIDHPSAIHARFLDFAGARSVYLHAMHSVVDWFAFGVWRAGKLQRSLSLSPDSGIVEDLGQRLPFETPYWDGAHPAIDPEDLEEGEPAYPFPFHPLELGEAALAEFFGYQLEGYVDSFPVDTETIPLLRYQRKKSFFRIG